MPGAGADHRGAQGSDGFSSRGSATRYPLICQFITEHRDRFGVAPICRALCELGVRIAPRTYFARITRPPSKRELWDLAVAEVLAGIYEPDEHGRRAPESGW